MLKLIGWLEMAGTGLSHGSLKADSGRPCPLIYGHLPGAASNSLPRHATCRQPGAYFARPTPSLALETSTVRWDPNEYDEQAQIAYTIILWHSHLMTVNEREMQTLFVIRAKAEVYKETAEERTEYERRVRSSMALSVDQDAADLVIGLGYQRFSRLLAERVMSEHGDQVVLNRCSKCERVVNTPMAKWCCWCKHDWH
jgi:hypothetical protein